MFFFLSLQPFWKKSGECNFVSGKIRMGNDLLCKIDGRWVGVVRVSLVEAGNLNILNS